MTETPTETLTPTPTPTPSSTPTATPTPTVTSELERVYALHGGKEEYLRKRLLELI